MSYIGDVAKAIMKTAAGENASITRAFSLEAMNDLGNAAMRADFLGLSKDLVNSAVANKIITADDLAKAMKQEGFGFESFARDIAQRGAGNNASKAYQETLANFNKKSDLFNNGDAVAYFGRKNGSIGWGNTAKGYFFDPQDGLGKTRMLTTFGGAAAGAVGMRYLSGGNLTTDAQGQRNIAGIPFV